ncbi:DUF2997 domain-containing protein [Microbacterium maritypicum]|uniref:DUF2997 domain-containing protein n=1 Tax=Microbacterium maritypicum TaxID=33918 RepID=UPI0022DF8181|nr:DUF2997 domain-containing protein [Microbacterium liquefaciens]
MTRKLAISILPDGTINAEASGTPGPDCLNAIDQLRRLLDAEVSDSRPTPEFNASVAPVRLQADDDLRLEDRA